MSFGFIPEFLRLNCAINPIHLTRKSSVRAILGIAVLGAITLFPSLSHAQTAHFSGAQYTLPIQGLSNPGIIAVDAQGNLYVADPFNNQVLKESLSSGNYSQTTVGTGLNTPMGVAVDTSGNVYIADSDNARLLKETLSGSTYTQSVIRTGIGKPSSVAVDPQGNVYVVDTANNRVYKETVSGNAYLQSTIGSNLVLPNTVAADAAGNVYISDLVTAPDYFTYYPVGLVYKETLSGGSYTQSTVASGLNHPTNVSLDSSGNVYISLDGTSDDPEASQLLKETPSGATYTQSLMGATAYYFVVGAKATADAAGDVYMSTMDSIVKVSSASGDLGSVNTGSSSTPVSLIFTFDSAGTIAAPQVVNQGTVNSVFTDAGTGTCDTRGTDFPYTAGVSCTVDVKLTPASSGFQHGASLLKSSAGSIIATGYAHGIGVAPQVSFSPGTQSTLKFSGTINPVAIAADTSGNLYIASGPGAGLCGPQNAVVKETLSGGSYQPTTIATGFACPGTLAVDGAGNVFVGDQDAFDVVEETPVGDGTYTQSTPFKDLSNVESVAVDDSGNVYIGGAAYGLLKETRTPSGYVQSVVSPISDVAAATSIAIDQQGNLYVVDSINNRVLKETASNGGYTESTIVSGLNQPEQVVVDVNGNLFITDNVNARILKETPSGGSYTQSVIWSGLFNPVGIALDGNGNLFISSDALDSVFKLDVVDPPSLKFPLTAVGSTSGSQSVTLVNSGNAELSFPVPASGSNPSLSSAFSLSGAGSSACPGVESGSSSPVTLPAGQSCSFAVSFAPTTAGDITGTLVLTDNNLNAGTPAYAQQSVSLSGTTPPASGLAFVTVAPQTYGNAPFTVSATSASSGAITYSVVSGPATISGKTVTLTGAGTVELGASQAANGSYSATSATTTFVVAPAMPTLSFTAIASQTYGAAPFKVSATSVSSGAVTYTVVSGPATISGATVTLTGAGTVTLDAVQAASGNYASAAATTNFTVAPEAFTLTGAGSTSATASSAGTATYSLTLTPKSGTSFPNVLNLSVTGLPANATSSFSPSSIQPGSGATTVTLTVQTGAQTARADSVHMGEKLSAVALGILLLPFAGMRSARKRLQRRYGMFAPVLLAGMILGGLAGLSGCGGGSSSTVSSGGSSTSTTTATTSQSYNLTVTATDAVTGAKGSTGLTLTVQ